MAKTSETKTTVHTSHHPDLTFRCNVWSGDARKCECAATHIGPHVATYNKGKRDEEVRVIIPRRGEATQS